jgi:hypothetical protein
MPRVWITEPDPSDDLDNPTSIDIKWSTDWKKWNGEKYTSSYADTFSETESLSFFVIYSDDGGSTWKYVKDSSLEATLGEIPRDANGNVITSVKSSGSEVNWSTSSLAKGTYFIRVECYRDNYNLHYSYHQSQIYIKK